MPIPNAKLFGLYDGVLTSAKSSPVLGCITTKNPSFSFNSLYNFVWILESIVNFIVSPFCTSILAISFFRVPSSPSMYISTPSFPFNLSSYCFSSPAFPITLVAVYPFPLFVSNSSAVIVCTYPTNCAAASPNGYVLPFAVVILTPGIWSNWFFKSVASIAIFFNGTNVSSLTHEADRLLLIEFAVVPNKFAIFSISASLLSLSFPGTIPTDDTEPWPANTWLFLSIIDPLSADIVFILTLSLLPKVGNIKLELQFTR